MSAKKIFSLLFVMAVAALTAAAQNVPGGSDVGREIRGLVRSASNNQPIPGAVVSLQSDIGEIIQQVSPEGSGSFVFQFLSRAVYYISAYAPGYRELRQRADLVMTRRVSVQLFLLEAETKPVGSPPPAGAVDAKYLQIPEEARKEFEKASLMLRDKDASGSLEYFRKAIALHKNFPAAHMLLGTAFMDLGRWMEAQGALEKSIQLDASQAAAHFALGSCLAAQGKFNEAEKPLKRGLEIKADAAQGHLELGRVYWALGRWQAAEPHARKAIALKPELPLAHVLMGNILLRKRDAPGALAEFKEYLRLAPDGPFAAGTREVIGKIEATLNAPKS
jgi:tetratricopeptide (TPR) repeat protein